MLMVGLFVSLLLVAGLAIDGGRAIATRTRAIGDAQEAARVGAQQLDQQSLLNGRAALDPTRARAAAEADLVANGESGTVTVSGDTVTVTVHAVQPTVLWRLAGVTTLTLSGTGSAQASRGA